MHRLEQDEEPALKGKPKRSSDEARLEAAHKARTGLGPLESAYVADAVGARAGARKVDLLRALSKSPDYPHKDLFSQLLLAGNNAGFGKNMYERIDRGASNLAENPKLRLLSAFDPTSEEGFPGLVDLTSAFGGSAESIINSKRRAGEAYAKFLKKHQDKLDPNAKPTARETPWHVDMQAVLANLDSDVAGHTYMRNESPYHYWLNPMSRSGPIKEVLDRAARRSIASATRPESGLGRFAATVASPLTLGLAPLVLGGEAAQQKLRSAAVKNNLYAPEAQPELKAASFGAYMAKRAHRVKTAANASGILGGALLGGGIGAIGGGLAGAINPGYTDELETEGPSNRRKYYLDDNRNRVPYYVDDEGDPLLKTRGRLSGAFLGGLSGLGWGGLIGGVLGNRIGSAGASTGIPTRPESGSINQSTGVMAPESSGTVTLKPFLSNIYDKIPGGLKAVVSAAQKHQDEARKQGLVTWNESSLDNPASISNYPSDWAQIASKVGYDPSSPNLRGVTTSIDPAGFPLGTPSVYINPNGTDKVQTYGHELTHAALKSKSFQPTAPIGDSSELVRNLMGKFRNASEDDLKGAVNYVFRPEEWKAHLAEIKREAARNGIHIDDRSKALDALLNAGKNPKGDTLRTLMPEIMKNPKLLDKAILQLLSIVKGDSVKPKGAYA